MGIAKSSEAEQPAAREVSGVESGLIPEIEAVEVTQKAVEGLRERVDDVKKLCEELGKMVAELSERVSVLESSAAEISSKLSGADIDWIKRSVYVMELAGLWKSRTCAYHQEGVCAVWSVTGDARRRLADEWGGNAIIVSSDGKAKVNTDVVTVLCSVCPFYRPRGGGSAGAGASG